MEAPRSCAGPGRLGVFSALAVVPLLGGCSDAAGGGASTGPGGEAGAMGAGGNAGGGDGDHGDGGGATGGGRGDSRGSIEVVLAALQADPDAALGAYAADTGWPVPVDGGVLVVTTDPVLHLVAGDHDGWTGTEMNQDSGFWWLVVPPTPGARYKLTDRTAWRADPWARSYTYDDFGEISLIAPETAHLDRYLAVGNAEMAPRTLRVWVPNGPVERVLYAHDGQNLFDPEAVGGGWRLQDHAPDGVLLVGIDNTPARMDEYTHVTDRIGGGAQLIGGKGDAYADFLRDTVRPLIRAKYGEPGPVGVMGSSLGGLISFHIADRHRGEYAFAASLSGTMGWGSIGVDIHHETMIERYAAHTEAVAVLYLDSGGDGSCFDGDGDGIEDDDRSAADNYCENLQMRSVLTDGQTPYQDGANLHYAWDEGAEHNEAAWAERVAEPLQIFARL